MKGDSTKMFAILVITVVSVAVLAFILWPQVQKWENVRFQGCTPCGDDIVKLEVINYRTAFIADQNVFEGVRVRMCNCRPDKINLLNARISHDVELPDGTTLGSGSYLLPKKGGVPIVPALEPQEGAKFDWYDMAPESDKVLVGGEESKSGKVTVKLLVNGLEEANYVWQIFYAPICPPEAVCRSDYLGEGYCRAWETNIGRLNCEADERCCK